MTLCTDCNLRPRINTNYCRECKNRRWRGHYARNRDQRCKRSQQWRIDNPELRQQQVDRMKDKYQDNPPTAEQLRYKYKRSLEAHLIGNSRRRARQLNQFIEDVDPRIVYEMHGGMCGICKEFVPQDDFEVDHVIPLSKGGMHGYVNVQPSHPDCNRKKGVQCE